MTNNINYIQTPPKNYHKKPTITKINILTGKEHDAMEAKKELQQALKLHKAEIKQAKRDIRKHKMLIKQAKLSYKINK